MTTTAADDAPLVKAPTTSSGRLNQAQNLRAQRIYIELSNDQASRVLQPTEAAEYLRRFGLYRAAPHDQERLSMAALAIILVKAGFTLDAVREILARGQ